MVQHGFEAIYYLSEVVRGIFVAMPTAIPEEPLIRSEGILEGQYQRFLFTFIVVGAEIHCIFVDVGHHFKAIFWSLASV